MTAGRARWDRIVISNLAPKCKISPDRCRYCKVAQMTAEGCDSCSMNFHVRSGVAVLVVAKDIRNASRSAPTKSAGNLILNELNRTVALSREVWVR